MERVTNSSSRYWPAAVAIAIGGYAMSWSWSESLQVVGNLVVWIFTCGIAAAFILRARGSSVGRSWVLAVAAFGGAVALTALWSIAPSDSVREAVKFGAVLLTAGSVGAQLQIAAQAGDELAAALAWLTPGALALTALVALVGFLDASAVPGPGASGFFNGPNVLAIFLALTLPFLLTRPSVASRPALSVGILALATFTAALSAGRTGLLALFFAVIVISLGARRSRRLALDLATCLLAIGLAIVWSPSVPTLGEPIAAGSDAAGSPQPTAPEQVDQLLGGGRGADQSLASALVGARDEGWAEGIRLLGERPLGGHGFGTGSTLFDRYDSRRRFTYFVGAFASDTNPHNSYLQMALELGIAGGALFLAQILLALALAARILIAGRSGPAELAFCASLVAASAAAFFESTLTEFGSLTLLSWIAAAAVAALWLRRRGMSSRRD